MMKKTPIAVAMKVITREDLLCVNTKIRSDIGIPEQQWMIEDHERFFLCYCCNETGLSYDEPLRWLTTGLSKLTTGLGEEGWAKPYVIVTQMPDAVGTASIGEDGIVLPIMWRTTASHAENLWYFLHEMTEFRLMTEMGDLPRWFWEGMAQVVAYLIVREMEPISAVEIQQRYLIEGIATHADYLQWDRLWQPAEDTQRQLSTEETIAAIFAAAHQVHFTAQEKRKYAKALEFFSERINSMEQVRALFYRAQQLPARTTMHLLALMEVPYEHCC